MLIAIISLCSLISLFKKSDTENNSFSIRHQDVPFMNYILPHLRKITAPKARNAAGLLLDANENRLGSPLNEEPLTQFSDAQHRALRLKLSLIKAMSPDQIMVSAAGIIEPIDLLIRATCAPAHENVIALTPVRPEFAERARIAHVQVFDVPLLADSFQIDMEHLSQTANEQTQIIYLASPNDQTGQAISHDDIEVILANFEGLVIVDESYINYSRFRSLSTQLAEHPNLVVLQSLNHAWGMAALNLGICMAHPDIIQVLEAIRVPNSIATSVQALAVQALDNITTVNNHTRTTVDLRQKLATQLTDLPAVERVFPSQANFLLVQFRDVTVARQAFAAAKIKVHQPASYLLPNCLRITVGTAAENEQVVAAIKTM